MILRVFVCFFVAGLVVGCAGEDGADLAPLHMELAAGGTGTCGPEVCDGFDNDCNRLVDDGFATLSCGVGACARTVKGCISGVIQTCSPGLPKPEKCDGIDNDCDGSIDEDLGTVSCGVGQCTATVSACVAGVKQECSPGLPSVEVCDGIDNDCNGGADDGLGILSCGTGLCANQVKACIGGQAQTCTPGTPFMELCDEIDNNCDGEIDDGFDGDKDGFTTCRNDCDDTDESVNPNAVEVCNDIDDNCDKFVDEGFDLDLDFYTVCQGDCDDDDATINPDMTEVCNDLDDNCDGQSDEGGVCSICGNGVIEGSEDCEDGNTVAGDGCDSNCIEEYCGDGTVNNVVGPGVPVLGVLNAANSYRDQLDASGYIYRSDRGRGNCGPIRGSGVMFECGACSVDSFTDPSRRYSSMAQGQPCTGQGYLRPNLMVSNHTAVCARTSAGALFDVELKTHASCNSGCVDADNGQSCAIAGNATSYVRTPAAAPPELCDDGGVSANCDANCQTKSCSDGIKNGDEFRVDCGGSCPRCMYCGDGITENGEECDTGGVSATCDIACRVKSCSDGLTNGDEVDVDCGGSCTACPIFTYCPGRQEVYSEFTVIAGDVNKPNFIQDGQGLAAGLSYATALRIDPTTGNVIWLENGNVRIITPSGMVSTWHSGSVSSYGTVAVDAAGYLWVPTNSSTLARVSPSGVTTTLALSQSIGNYGAASLNIGPDGQLYAAYYAGRPAGCSTPTAPDCGGLMRISPTTGQVTVLYETNTLSVPTDLVIDADLNVYVADPNYQRIHRYSTATGTNNPYWKTGNTYLSLALDSDGNVFGTSGYGRKFAPSGVQLGYGFAGHGYGVVVDVFNNVYVPYGQYTTGWAFELRRYDDSQLVCQ